MNTREVAEKLGTDPRRLRRFLRSDNTYRNAGQGGRYEFTDKDIPTLRKRFAAWDESTSKPTSEKSPAVQSSRRSRADAPGMDASIANKPAGKLTRTERERRDKLSRERVDRLEARLMAAGLHVSQRRDS